MSPFQFEKDLLAIQRFWTLLNSLCRCKVGVLSGVNPTLSPFRYVIMGHGHRSLSGHPVLPMFQLHSSLLPLIGLLISQFEVLELIPCPMPVFIVFLFASLVTNGCVIYSCGVSAASSMAMPFNLNANFNFP